MKIILILRFFVFLSIFVITLLGFSKHHLGRRNEKIMESILATGILYFILGLFVSFWFFDILDYNAIDYLAIYAIVIFIQTLLFFRIVFLLTSNKRLYYVLFLYLLSFLSIFSPISNFLTLSLISSFLFAVVLFVYLTSVKKIYKKTSYAGIVYALVSLVSFILLVVNTEIFNFFKMISIEVIYIIVFVQSLLLLVLIHILLEVIRKYPLSHLDYLESKEKHYLLILLRHFIFIVVLTNFIFIGTIGIHELGHFGLSKFYNCDHQRIVYDGSFPHTEIICSGFVDNNLVLIGGIAAPILLSIIIFILGETFIRSVAFMILGFNLIASSKDFLDMGISDNVIVASLFAGVLFSIIGIMMLAKSKVDNDF